MHPCGYCLNAIEIINDECREEPGCKIKGDMSAYIQGIEPCPFRTSEE